MTFWEGNSRIIMNERSLILKAAFMTNMERKKIDKKEQIDVAAVKSIAQTGYHEATMQDIAHEAGLAVGTLYN